MDGPPQLTNGHSAAATMQHQPSASSTGPQIRSRITVVCAECKRLKLKCDRRTPCGSCTKRDTVARCTYSPAAAEKVDLHSLNNRLIQVEHAMALITAGQNLPAFQSSYPLAFPTGTSNPQQPMFSSVLVSNSPGSHQHQHHHHYAVPSSHISAHDSLAPSSSDLSSIWLQDLDLSIPSSATGSSSTQRPRSFSNAENAGLIKLEPSPIDIGLSQPQTNAPAGDDSGQPSRASSPLKRMRNERHQQQQQRSSAQLLLPALSIYYPLPSIPPSGTSSSSSALFPLHPSSASPSSTPPSTSPASNSVNNGYSSSSHLPAPCTKPQVTQALLALLPSSPTCTRLLHNARDVLRIRPIPFESAPGQGWKQFENRCLTLLGGGANKERDKEREKKEREREKAREARRARQIYFGGIPGLQPHVTLDTEMDDVAAAGSSTKNTAKSNGENEDGTGDDHSLTFFAVMCAVLAIGASMPSSSAPLTTTTDAIKENPAFLYALSQQALGVWDTHTSSTSSGSALTAAEETEKLDYLLACIAGLSYLLFSNSPARAVGAGDAEREGTVGLGLIYPLVGKLVNTARGMGLAKDSSVLTSVLSRKGKHPSDEAAASERPGASAAHGPGSGAPGKVVSKREREAERERIREEWKKMIWWEVLYYDLFTADALGHQSYIPAYLFGMKLPACSSSAVSSHTEQQDSDDSGGFDGLGVEQEDFRSKARFRPSRNVSSAGGDDSEHEEDYFGARYRLTQLTQRIKSRLTHPDCCCGYTLDQAAQLEAEIRQWQATLPVALRWTELPAMIPDAAVPLVHERHGPNAEKVVHLQSCELAVMGNLLLVKVYTPFLRYVANTGSSANVSSGLMASGLDRNSTPARDTASISTSAAQTTLHASQLIIRAVKDAYATQRAITIFSSPSSSFSPSASPGKTNSWPMAVSPAMFDLYPVDRVVFHAAVVCAHAGLADKPPPPLAMDVDAVLDDATVGLGALLMEQGAPSVGPLGHAQRKVADVLYKRTQFRVNSASHGTKRKHGQANLSNVSNAFGFWMPNGQSSNIISLPGPEHDWLDSVHYQGQGSAVDIHAPTQAPGPPNFTQDQPKPDLVSAVRQAVAARSSAREDDEKDKKYAKKASYPSVGFRVRPGKDTQTRPRQLSSAAQQPLMTSTPRPLPSADTVLAYQQQQKQKLQAIADGPPANGGPSSSSSYDDDLNRSRSSSFSHVQSNPPQQQQQQQSSQHPDGAAEDLQYPFFGGATPSEILNMQQMLPRKRYSIHEQTQPPQPLSPEHPPFTPHIFDQSHSQAMYDQAYDGSSGAAVEGIGYSTVSSPFSNGAPTSSSGSPFTTTSVVSGGHPPTPTFGPHAPVFGPQPPDPLPTSSPTTYFHTPNAFNDSTYPGPSTSSAHLSHQQQHNMALGLNMEMSISSTPGYEKAAHQNAMYDLKSSIEQHQIAHQQRQMPPMEGYDDQGHQLGMGMPAAASWTAEQQRQQPQQPHQQSPSNAFWNNGPEYRFYP